MPEPVTNCSPASPPPPAVTPAAAPSPAAVAESRPARPAVELDAVDRAIIDRLQGDFPIAPRPYAVAAARLGIGEGELLARLESLLARRVLTRFGPLYQVERMGGAFVLAALQVPEARFEEVAAAVNALPEVAHNYRREHAFNMWFVLATARPEGIPAAIAKIEAATGLVVHAFPKEREYFVEMKLPVHP